MSDDKLRQVPCAPVDKWLLERAMALLGAHAQGKGGLGRKPAAELRSILGAMPASDAEASHWKSQLKRHRRVIYG